MHPDTLLRESLVKSTKILSGKNVKVLMEGFQPRVTFDPRTKKPKEIVLPMIPDNCPKDLLDAVKGYQDHEAAHVLYSSFDDICDSSKDKVWHYLHNVIDDNHINARIAQDFPGTHIELKNGYNYIFNNMDAYKHDHIEKMFATNPKQATAGYIVPWVASKMGSDFTRDWYDASPLPKLMKHLDDKLPDDLAEKLANCKTPEDVSELTSGMYTFLEQYQEELKKMADKDSKSKDGKDPKKSDKSDKSEKGKGEPDKDAKGKPKDGDKGEEGEKKKGDKPSDGAGDGKGKPDPGKGGEEEDYDEDRPPIDVEDLPGSFEDGLAGAIGKNIEMKFKQTRGTFFWSNRMNELVDTDNYAGNSRAYGGRSASNPLKDATGLDKFDLECKQVSSYLRKKLERMLESRSRVYRTGGHKSGRLHAKQLFSIPLGNTHVFTKKNDIRAVNAAVGLLMDLSGSMGGSKVKLASQCTYTVADCLDRLKIPFEALGFWTDNPVGINISELRRAWDEFTATTSRDVIARVVNSVSPNSTFVFKGFDQPFGLTQKASLLAASKGSIGMCQNEDATHLKIALERLSKQPQEKKVLFVFSDGQPAFSSYGHQNSCQSKLKELADNAMKDYGVTVVGIGIESSSVKHFYKNSKVITKLEELPNTVFDILTKQLMDRN